MGTVTETITVTGDKLVSTVKDLAKETKVHRIRLRNSDGDELIDIPVAAGIAGVVILPVLAAVGAIAAVVSDVTIGVAREEG